MSITYTDPAMRDQHAHMTVKIRVPLVQTPMYRAGYVNQVAMEAAVDIAIDQIASGECTHHDSSESFLASIRNRIDT